MVRGRVLHLTPVSSCPFYILRFMVSRHSLGVHIRRDASVAVRDFYSVGSSSLPLAVVAFRHVVIRCAVDGRPNFAAGNSWALTVSEK